MLLADYQTLLVIFKISFGFRARFADCLFVIHLLWTRRRMVETFAF